jgi:hypothetical protein
MKISVDKTGFPLVEVKELGIINIWPITKVQFERFMSETNMFGDKWYDSLLRLNPRISYKYFDKNSYERLFLTGIKPEEVISFAHWLGEDFDLLTLDEWRSVYRVFGFHSVPELPATGLSTPANTIWLKLRAFSKTLTGFALMHDGLIEWVRKGTNYIGLGTPRHSFLPNAYNPLNDEVILLEERLFYLGFRLIRR